MGIENDEDEVERVEVTPNHNNTLFHVHNRFTNERHTLNYEQLYALLSITDICNNPREFNSMRHIVEEDISNIPPNVPTEDPSSNPTPLTTPGTSSLPKEPD